MRKKITELFLKDIPNPNPLHPESIKMKPHGYIF
jgi:hypothetical protein